MDKRIAAAVCLALLALPGCGRDDALEELQLRELEGQVDVVRDGEVNEVSGTFDLQPGDLVVTRRNGFAEFALEGGDTVRAVELQGSSAALVRSTTVIEAREGHVLVRASEPTVAAFNDVRARIAHGRLRIDRGFGATRVAVYTGGRATLASPGERDLVVPSLREATVVAGDFPDEVVPYRIDTKDPWDQTELQSVLKLEENLEQLARGFSNQLGGARPSLAYFAALNEGDAGFVQPFLTRPPVDLLVAFIIATKAPGEPGANLRSAFELRADGGSWGVVSAILGAEPGAVLAQLKALILGTGVAKEDGRGGRFSVAAAEASQDAGSTSTSGQSDPADQPPAESDPQPPPDEDPPKEKPKDPPEEPDECTDTADCTFQEIGEQVNPSPSPSPTDAP